MGFESVVCNGCGSADHAILFEVRESPDERQPPAWRGAEAIPLVRCRNCGLCFLTPRYDDERLTALYQDPQMFKGTIDPEGRSRSIAAERPQRVAQFRADAAALSGVRASGRLLDVGCGLGFFLEALPPGYDAIGLEWSRPVVDMLRQQGARVVEGRFPDSPFRAGAFDIITFHNSLDHLPDPARALRVASGMLAPGGVLMLSLVNFGSLAARVYGPGFRLLGPNHLYYFTVRTLRAFLERAGLALLRVEYPYFGTQFAHPLADSTKIARDFLAMRVLRRATRLSPPFYGNLMRVFAARR